MPAVRLVILCAWRDGDPVACDPQTLMTQASCIQSCLMPDQISAASLAVLCEINGGDCAPQALQTLADCQLQCMSPLQIMAAQLVVLCDIANP